MITALSIHFYNDDKYQTAKGKTVNDCTVTILTSHRSMLSNYLH